MKTSSKLNIITLVFLSTALFCGCSRHQAIDKYSYPCYWEDDFEAIEICLPPQNVLLQRPLQPSKPVETKPVERKPEVIKGEPKPKKIEEPPLAPAKLKRRQVSRPYGIVIPFSEQCCKEEDERERAKHKPDEWEKISAWIFKD